MESVAFLPRPGYPDSVDRQRFDLCLRGGTVVEVRSGAHRGAAVAVSGDRISAIGGDDDLAAGAARVIDVRGGVIVPGYIEPHTHAVLANPVEYAYAMAARGTTTAVVDALALMMVVPSDRLPGLLDRLGSLPVTLRWLIRLHPQSFADLEAFSLERLRRLWRLPAAAAVGEVTRWPDVLAGDASLLDKMRAAAADGRRIEGHAPGASREKLAALTAAGFTSDHEAITSDEVLDRLHAGLYTMLRHSSIRPDLPALLRGIPDAALASSRVMLTADGPNPAFIEAFGYQDSLVQMAINAGVPPMTALRMVTLNPAEYFGFHDRGEIEPGRRADLVVVPDLSVPHPTLVIAGGTIIARDGEAAIPPPPIRWDEIQHTALPRLDPGAFAGSSANVPTVRLVSDVITELVTTKDHADVVQANLVARNGRWITRSLLQGFVDRLGGLATTLSSGFDVLVLGQSPSDMAAAMARLAQLGGGIVVIDGGAEQFSLALDLGGAYSSRPWAEVVSANRRFNELTRSYGHGFADPILSLLFLAFDSLPWVRLTSRGIWDVRHRKILHPSQPL